MVENYLVWGYFVKVEVVDENRSLEIGPRYTFECVAVDVLRPSVTYAKEILDLIKDKLWGGENTLPVNFNVASSKIVITQVNKL